MESNIIPNEIVPSIAVIATIIASAIIPLENPFAGSFIWFTYGDIFSQPPTANTKIETLVKNGTLNLGIKVLKDQSILFNGASVIAGAVSINKINNIDITNIEVPAKEDNFFNGFKPFDAIYIAIAKIIKQLICNNTVFILLILLSWKIAQLDAIIKLFGFCERYGI